MEYFRGQKYGEFQNQNGAVHKIKISWLLNGLKRAASSECTPAAGFQNLVTIHQA